MKRLALILALGLVAGCGKDTPPATESSVTSAPNAQAGSADAATPLSPAATVSQDANKYANRSGELGNPDDSAMVMLYRDLANLPPPIERWVEADNRLQFAPAPQKAGIREQITREYEAARDAVKGVGVLRLTLANAQLSDYDPSYGEFTIRALSPSSTVEYKTLGETVTLKFDNARTAQLWKASADEAQAVRDKLGNNYGRAAPDITLAVTGVVPGPAGGTITTRIIEYELRDRRSSNTLARKRFD